MCSVFPAVAEAVLGCIEQSRRLILVPSSLGLNPGQDSQYSLLTGLHAALVERQTWLILIQTESAPDSQVVMPKDEFCLWTIVSFVCVCPKWHPIPYIVF